MEREHFDMPAIPSEAIDPRKNISRERHAEQGAMREGLSEKIHEWWRGDAHAHSTESTREGFPNAEGIYNFEEMAAYYQGLGLEFAAITEHASLPAKPELQSPDSKISQSLSDEAERIAQYNRERGGEFALLSGVEASIFFDEKDQPAVDVPPEVLEKLDLVIASRHGIAREKEFASIETSLTHAIEHPNIDVIGHPDRNLVAEHDWNFFRKNFPEAQAYHDRMTALQKEKAAVEPAEQERMEKELQDIYRRLRKAVGQDPLTVEDQKDEELLRWRAEYERLTTPYYEMWGRLLGKMAKERTAFELNMGAQPNPQLVKMAADAGVLFFLNFDAHDFDKYKWQHSEEQQRAYGAKKRWAEGSLTREDEHILREYKMDRLGSGPGVIPILRLARWIATLESLGVTPERVVNSSKDRLVRFLKVERGKETKNLREIIAQGS